LLKEVEPIWSGSQASEIGKPALNYNFV